MAPRLKTALLLSFFFATTLAAPSIDLCYSGSVANFSPLGGERTPWRPAKRIVGNESKSDFEILFCSKLKSLKNYTVHPNCLESEVCKTIKNKNGDRYIGMNPVMVERVQSSVIVHYQGPSCSDGSNFTLDIRFICGEHYGYPRYSSSLESECHSYMLWETSLACRGNSDRLKEMRCHVHDDKGMIRDLSPLIRNTSFQVMNANDREYFMSVCTDAGDKCPLGSSSCYKDKTGSVVPIGSYKWSSITFHPSSQLTRHEYIELIYKSKTYKCNDKMPAITKIRFTCPSKHDSPISGPFLVSSLDCEYEIEWFTDLACSPQETTAHFDSNNCNVNNAIDFKDLRATESYEVANISGSGKSIFLNFCGENSKCQNPKSICLYDPKDKSSQNIGNIDKATYVNADNQAKVVFETLKCTDANNARVGRTIIYLECGNVVGKPEFIDKQTCTYVLRWRSPAFCKLFKPPQACSYYSSSPLAQYDLSPLKSSVYTIDSQDSRSILKNDEKIILNICDNIPINKLNSTLSACSHSSACLVNSTGAMSLGSFNAALTMNSKSNLELRYQNGFNSVTKQNVETRIQFVCGAYLDDKPFLKNISPNGSFIDIVFKTVHACPMYKTTSFDCQVHDPVLGETFDLNVLRSPHYYTVKSDRVNHEFLLNICGPISGESTCGKNVAICQRELTGAKRSFSLGKASSTVHYFRSTVNMTFTDGSPYNDAQKTTRSSHISFICDRTAGHGHPEFDGEQDRAYFFRWYTDLVCPGGGPKITHCTFANHTHYADLSPLSVQGSQHSFMTDNALFIFNLCRPLSAPRDPSTAACKSGTGLCKYTHITQKGKQISYGQPFGDPFIGFDSSIYLLFKDGDQCPGHPQSNLSARMRLECDESIDTISITMVEPETEDLSDPKHCTLELIARTPFACLHKFEELDKCVFTDKRTNFQLDLNGLTRAHHDYRIQTSGKPSRYFAMNMCQSVSKQSDECKDAAVCFQQSDSQWLNYGSFKKTKVLTKDSSVLVVFLDGSVCTKSPVEQRRTTEVQFVCDESAIDSKPQLLSYDQCQARFRWITSAACGLKMPSCSLMDYETGNYYSLRLLSSLSHYWNTTTSDGKQHYRLNLCKALPLASQCGPSSAICLCEGVHGECKQDLGKAGQHELELDDNKNLVLRYVGQPDSGNCPVTNTLITFICSNETGLAGPRLVDSMLECSHFFQWKTVFACSTKLQQELKSLKLDDGSVQDETGFKWNISPIFKSVHKTREVERDNYTYTFDFSGQSFPATRCSNAAVCQTKSVDFKRNIGKVASYHFTSFGTDLFMTIASDSKCGRNARKNATTKIVFACSQTNDIGEPRFAYENDDCDYVFEWHAVCGNARGEQNYPAKRSEVASSSALWIVFVFLVSPLLVFALWLSFSKSSKRDDVVCYIRRVLHHAPEPEIPFRYQQLSKT